MLEPMLLLDERQQPAGYAKGGCNSRLQDTLNNPYREGGEIINESRFLRKQ